MMQAEFPPLKRTECKAASTFPNLRSRAQIPLAIAYS